MVSGATRGHRQAAGSRPSRRSPARVAVSFSGIGHGHSRRGRCGRRLVRGSCAGPLDVFSVTHEVALAAARSRTGRRAATAATADRRAQAGTLRLTLEQCASGRRHASVSIRAEGPADPRRREAACDLSRRRVSHAVDPRATGQIDVRLGDMVRVQPGEVACLRRSSRRCWRVRRARSGLRPPAP